MQDEFIGNPHCGLIDPDNKWAIVAGKHLTIWRPEECIKIVDEEVNWIHSIRIKDSNTVEILTDPWKRNSAIWEINPQSYKYIKVKDFNDYKNKEYSENVIW